MATPTYTIKVLKVENLAVDLEVKAALDEIVYCWPSLALRALAGGPGSPLATLDLSTREGVKAAAEAWVERVEILATRKGLAQYRICAGKPGLSDKLKKGMAWPCSASHVDDHSYGPGVLAAHGKLAAVVVKPGSVVPSGAVELLAVTKKGPGATKGWLNHVGVSGVGALGPRILTWSADRARIWSDAQELLEEHEAKITCACLTATGVALGTPEGLVLDGERIALGPVRALAWSDELLHVLNADCELIALSGATERRRLRTAPGHLLAVSGDQAAIAGDDDEVRWYRGDALLGKVQQSTYKGRAIHGAASVPGGLAVAGIHETFIVHGDGRVQELLPSLDATQICAEAGLVLAMTHGDVVRARIWREDGGCVGELALPRGNLHRAQLPPRPPPIRLTPDGAWVLCAEHAHQNGGVRLVGTRGQGQVRFPNPNQGYDFLTDVEAIGAESFLIGYGNHDAIVWNLDGTSRGLGRRIDSIWNGHGRLLTSKDKEVTEWDADWNPIRSFSVDVPYGLHWLEASGDGRFVVLGAQPRAWVHDLETGEQWDIVQPGGVNDPTFAGHPHCLLTSDMNQGQSRIRLWDARERRIMAELEKPSYAQRCRWLPGGEVLLAGVGGVWAADPDGNVRALLELPPGAQGADRVVSLGFDGKGRLLTHGERSHLHAWKSPGQGKSYGGYFGPSAFEHEPGWGIVFGVWPALAVRIPA